MNVHFTYKLDKSPTAEQYLQSQIEKLGPRLHVFNPDMVSLRGSIEVAPKSGFMRGAEPALALGTDGRPRRARRRSTAPSALPSTI